MDTNNAVYSYLQPFVEDVGLLWDDDHVVDNVLQALVLIHGISMPHVIKMNFFLKL
jgi:hypothetical protein